MVPSRCFRQHSSEWVPNEPLMDLTNPGWRAICVQICQNALSKGFDGLVLDNGLTSPNVLWPGSWSGSDSQWQSSTISLYKSIKQAAGSKIVIYNGAYFIPGYVDALDGYMDEGFPFYKGWDHSIGFALDASTNGKIALFYAQGNVFDAVTSVYCSALLTDGYFFYAPTGTTWFNDYGIQLGTALNKAEKMSDGTWQRDYQYGTVVVNPSAQTAHIDLKTGQNVQSATTPKVTTTVKQATPTPKVTTTVKQATPTPKVTTTVKQATSTPKATTTVKQATLTPSLTKTVPTKAKATLTPRLVAASKQASGQSSNSSSNSLIAAKNASEMPDNASVLGTVCSSSSNERVASLPPQPF